MAYQTFPWNTWIEFLMRGEPQFFLDGLRRSVFGSAYFRGKTTGEIYQQFGEANQDDIVQITWLEVVERGAIYSYRNEGLSDEEIAGRIINKINSRIIDAARKRRRQSVTFCSSATENDSFRNLPDRRPSPEEDLMNQGLISSVTSQLSPRQSFILNNYERFGIGEMKRGQLARALRLSVQMIDKEIGKIKTKLREIAKEWRVNTKWK